jgi:hypothetical protein
MAHLSFTGLMRCCTPRSPCKGMSQPLAIYFFSLGWLLSSLCLLFLVGFLMLVAVL